MDYKPRPVSKARQRPDGVPAKAWWDAGENEWVLGPMVEGKKHGTFTFWRPDGTRCNECHFEAGVPHGPFKRFHEDGAVSQEGQFERGQLHGTRRWCCTDGETTERTRPEGVHESVWTSEMDYEHGRVVAIRHLDREGVRVLPGSGEPYPERPESVDPHAEYVEPKDEWHRGDAMGEDQRKVGRWRVWSREGELLEEGSYVDGERAGAWTFSGARCDYGDTSSLSQPRLQAFSNDAGFDYAGLAARLEGEGKVVEALVTWARAAGCTKDATGFRALLTKVARVLPEDAALALAREVDRPLNWIGLELVSGAHPAVLVNQLAVALDQAQQSRAALDFTNAAILLDPERSEFLFTRALILMSLGLEAQAKRDANELAAEAPDRAEFLLSYLAALFPTWGFTPAREQPVTTFEDVPEKPERSLEEIAGLAQKYATRLALVREAMLGRLTEANPALPPDLSRILTDGPVALEAGEAEDEEGETVSWDESLELGNADLPSLLRLARADWAALSWLCWSAGLEEVALPTTLSPPADFGKAAGMARQRLWRARDQRVFEGRNARAHDVPSFEWEGVDVGELPPPVAGIAEQQYAEMQALFLWLVDPNLKSPWQDHLRGS